MIVNEFGDAGVDGEILKSFTIPNVLRKISSSLQMAVLPDGC